MVEFCNNSVNNLFAERFFNFIRRNTMGKIEVNKKQKKESLLNTAFSLFTSKASRRLRFQVFLDNAGVAKGTFYLYFSDKIRSP